VSPRRGRRQRTPRPLLEFMGTLVAVVVALGVAYVLSFTAFLFLLLAITLVVMSMWVIARR
jgi:hypothetical protein